ncbi:MAG: zf-HC2 domain-containing protein [Acidobacteriota bacterium]|nr:zf-HC2 domain-containing protein [Acidobacteriota bacterium]
MDKTTSSTCIELDALLEAHLDGELGEFETARLRRHLDGCPRCQHELAWAEQIRQGLRELPQLACPQSVMESVRALGPPPTAEGHVSSKRTGGAEQTSATLPDRSRASKSRSSAEPPTPSSAIPTRPLPRGVAWGTSSWRTALIAASIAAALLTGWLLRPLLTESTQPSAPVTAEQGETGASPAETGEAGSSQQASVPRAPASPETTAGAAAGETIAEDSPTPGTQATEPSAQELARAKEEVQLALAYLDAVNRRAAVAIRDQALTPHVAEAPEQALAQVARQL